MRIMLFPKVVIGLAHTASFALSLNARGWATAERQISRSDGASEMTGFGGRCENISSQPKRALSESRVGAARDD